MTLSLLALAACNGKPDNNGSTSEDTGASTQGNCSVQFISDYNRVISSFQIVTRDSDLDTSLNLVNQFESKYKDSVCTAMIRNPNELNKTKTVIDVNARVATWKKAIEDSRPKKENVSTTTYGSSTGYYYSSSTATPTSAYAEPSVHSFTLKILSENFNKAVMGPNKDLSTSNQYIQRGVLVSHFSPEYNPTGAVCRIESIKESSSYKEFDQIKFEGKMVGSKFIAEDLDHVLKLICERKVNLSAPWKAADLNVMLDGLASVSK